MDFADVWQGGLVKLQHLTPLGDLETPRIMELGKDFTGVLLWMTWTGLPPTGKASESRTPAALAPQVSFGGSGRVKMLELNWLISGGKPMVCAMAEDWLEGSCIMSQVPRARSTGLSKTTT